MKDKQQMNDAKTADGRSGLSVGLDTTPEHTKRGSVDHATEGDLHPEIIAAYDYVDSVAHTSDFRNAHAWHGWALREAFLAGISYSQNKVSNEQAKGRA